MKRYIKTFALIALALASCQQIDNPEPNIASGKVVIDPIITRATEVDFEEGDKIGLTIATSEGDYAVNSCLTYSSDLFSGDLLWYTDGYAESTLYAYYPYEEAGAPSVYIAVEDQSAGISQADFMLAVKTGVLPSTDAVTMTFKHMMTKLMINVTNESGSEVEKVVLKCGDAAKAVGIDYENAALTDYDGALSTEVLQITACEVTENTTWAAIVVPHTGVMAVEITLANGKIMTQNLVSMTFKSGGQYTINSRVLADDIDVTISGTIENWTEEGDVAFEGDAEIITPTVEFAEYEDYFIYDGVRYATVTLANGQKWMAENLRYVPAGYTPSADPTVESGIWYPYETVNPAEGATSNKATSVQALTDSVSVEKFGYLYDFSTAFGGVEITVDNCYDFEKVQGLCPEGWYIPTRADYLGLCGLSNKNALGETGNVTDTEALFYDATYGGGKVSLFNDAGWNLVYSGARQQSNFSATPTYQNTQLYSGNCSDSSLYGQLALTFYMTSTAYKPVYSTSDATLLTNIQFFGMMTTFGSLFPEGKVSLSYASIKAGLPLRCVKADNQ